MCVCACARVCVCARTRLALSFLSKGLVSALEAIKKGKEVPIGKTLTTELQQCETLYNIKYHKIFQCAKKEFQDSKMLCKNDQCGKGSQMEATLFMFFVQSLMMSKHYEETVRGKTCYNLTSR